MQLKRSIELNQAIGFTNLAANSQSEDDPLDSLALTCSNFATDKVNHKTHEG